MSLLSAAAMETSLHAHTTGLQLSAQVEHVYAWVRCIMHAHTTGLQLSAQVEHVYVGVRCIMQAELALSAAAGMWQARGSTLCGACLQAPAVGLHTVVQACSAGVFTMMQHGQMPAASAEQARIHGWWQVFRCDRMTAYSHEKQRQQGCANRLARHARCCMPSVCWRASWLLIT